MLKSYYLYKTLCCKKNKYIHLTLTYNILGFKSIRQLYNMPIVINFKSQKRLSLKWTCCLLGIDHRIALLFKRYVTTKEIIPESLKSMGQL